MSSSSLPDEPGPAPTEERLELDALADAISRIRSASTPRFDRDAIWAAVEDHLDAGDGNS